MMKMLTAVETADVDDEFGEVEQRHNNYQKMNQMELLGKKMIRDFL